jgi:putative methanogenesis marker protein 3
MPQAKMITVNVDGSTFQIQKGERLANILLKANIKTSPGSLILIGIHSDSQIDTATKLCMLTSKGEMIVRFNNESRLPFPLIDTLLKDTMEIQQNGANATSIGTFIADMKGQYQEYQLSQGDIYIDLVGMDSKHACLVLCKKRHTAYYSLIRPYSVGRIISGIELLHDMRCDDNISFRRVETKEQTNLFSFVRTNDLGTEITEDGTRIITSLSVELSDKTPEGGELFFHSFKNGIAEISSSTGSCVSTSGLRGFQIKDEKECFSDRDRGCISLRKKGKQQGDYYFYRRDRSKTSSHICIGEVTNGIELVDLAEKGDRISMQIFPSPVNCVGLSQCDAEDLLRGINLEQIRLGDLEDGAIVVQQKPESSLRMKGSASVETTGLSRDLIVGLTLSDTVAPRTTEFFRAITGLKFASVGRLRIAHAFSPALGTILLSGDRSKINVPELKSENTPYQKVRIGVIGITNSVVDRMGTIGIRMKESDEFGPTCEHFESSNIIGTVTKESIAMLKRCTMGDDIYIMEIINDGTSRPPTRKVNKRTHR